MIEVKIGQSFVHPDLGLVRYIGPAGRSCELKKIGDNWPSRYPSWIELYELGFSLQV